MLLALPGMHACTGRGAGCAGDVSTRTRIQLGALSGSTGIHFYVPSALPAPWSCAIANQRGRLRECLCQTVAQRSLSCQRGARRNSQMSLDGGLQELQLSEGSAEDSQMSLPGSGGSDVEAAGVAAGSGGARRVSGHPPGSGCQSGGCTSVRALPRFGCFSATRGVEKFQVPWLLQLPPLGIGLRQVAGADHRAGCQKRTRLSGLVRPGREPILAVYGTLRCFPATHRVAKVLTIRGQRELPSCLHFDPHVRQGLRGAN